MQNSHLLFSVFYSPLHEDVYMAYFKSDFNLFEMMSDFGLLLSYNISFVDVSNQTTIYNVINATELSIAMNKLLCFK